jgi:hypothetical protein
VLLEIRDANVNGCRPHSHLGQDLPRESQVTEARPTVLPEIATIGAGETRDELLPPRMTGQDEISEQRIH